MGSHHFAYLLIDLLSISIPLWRSFDPRLNLHRRWSPLFIAIGLTGLFFIIWDVLFTHWGVWGFNPHYLTGLDIINLPVEEWLFFICIPYACVFTYDALNYFIRKDVLKEAEPFISALLVLGLLIIAFMHLDRAYTATTFILLSAFIVILKIRRVGFLGRFYLAYAVILVPFFIVNGLLTGSFIPDQIVWYNDNENLGIRMGTIPVEDTFYGMLLILMNVTFYEWLKPRFARA